MIDTFAGRKCDIMLSNEKIRARLATTVMLSKYAHARVSRVSPEEIDRATSKLFP